MTELKRTLRFVRRASPVLPEHRPLYKIAQMLLVLELASRGGKSSLPRLQLFNWALKTIERKGKLLAAAKDGKLNVNAWGFDPAVAIALKFADAEGLIERTSTGYQITARGKDYVRSVMTEPDSLLEERTLLQSIGKSITDTMVSDVAKSWGLA